MKKLTAYLKTYGPIALAGIILVAGICLLARGCSAPKEVTAPEPAEEEVPENIVWVHDGANTIPITPYVGVPVSTLISEEFSQDGDIIKYTGSSYTALQGVDVSEWQGDIDWQTVAADGIDFAIIRIGFRGCGEGTLEEDSSFFFNYEQAKEAGLQVGVYYFSQSITAEEAKKEAEWVLKELDERTPSLPVFFDWEPVVKEGSRTKYGEHALLTDCAAAFCSTIEAAGLEAGVYYNCSQCYNCYDLSQLTDYSFWLTAPGSAPDCYYASDFWQYSFEGQVNGIPNAVDRNIMFMPRIK